MLLFLISTMTLSAGTTENPTATFPLTVSENGRLLLDATGKPFFYNADTAWMLFLKLNPAEAEEYMALRMTQGFNAIQVMLTGFAGMKNRNGDSPFNENNQFAFPNEAYFSHVDQVIEKANEMNLLLSIIASIPLFIDTALSVVF